MQIVVIAALRTPHLAEVADDVSYLRLNAVPLEMILRGSLAGKLCMGE